MNMIGVRSGKRDWPRRRTNRMASIADGARIPNLLQGMRALLDHRGKQRFLDVSLSR